MLPLLSPVCLSVPPSLCPCAWLQRPSCGYVLCTVLLSLAVLLAVTVTGAVLFLNHTHTPGTALPPVVSTGPAGANSALVTVDRSEQAHLLQLLSESQGHMAHLVNLVSDVLDALHRDRGLSRPRVKADLQRAPARGARPRGCANGSRPRDCLGVLLSGRCTCTCSGESGSLTMAVTTPPPALDRPASAQSSWGISDFGGRWGGARGGLAVPRACTPASLRLPYGHLRTSPARLGRPGRREEVAAKVCGRSAVSPWFSLRVTSQAPLPRTLHSLPHSGLKRLHALTAQAAYELHVDLEDFDNGTAYAHYRSFGVGLLSVDPEEDGYPLTVADYSGTAGDSLLRHSGLPFTTKDRDSDHSDHNCAAFYRGAWWYRNCHTSNLNGQYLRGAHASRRPARTAPSVLHPPRPGSCSVVARPPRLSALPWGGPGHPRHTAPWE
ncbi:PREDICTED: fibrinogen C domain-containing protein 1 [Myotis davidii]|uniref:fibrinogen C domain-containing protein 1 n=1 Tax=Myotis davidii TaxID=225400 RepID=UPI00076765C3|nr:PREDICTED: fibrinogen C domain-containing protein 1 [Myotis davidii]